MKLLFIGDIVGKPGRNIIRNLLPGLRKQYGLDLVIANGENMAGGVGVTYDTAQELFSAGVDIITTGNHVWNKKDVLQFIEHEPRLVRPGNYPPGTPGKGYALFTTNSGLTVAVLNLCGRVFLDNLDCPFRTAELLLESLAAKAELLFLDFHAEATSEKLAMAHFLDGRVAAVCGTHTHVQTNDAVILPRGTAYITDAGMTGPVDSILGVDKDLVIKKFRQQMPVRFEVAKGGPCCLNGVLIDIDEQLKRAKSIETLSIAR